MARTQDPEIIDVPVPNPEVSMAQQEGSAISDFLNGLAPFFTRAKQLEAEAKVTLAEAQAYLVPTNSGQDEGLQSFIRKTAIDKKAVEAHWGITTLMHGFHKRLVAARTRATQPLEEANRIGNQLHNQYVETERRRAAEKQEQMRRDAEAKAMEERLAEIAEMEASALKAEENSPTLSGRESLFVTSFVGGMLSAERCAKIAGYKDPFTAASRLLSQPKIQAAVKAQQDAKAAREQAAAKKAQPLDVQVEEVRPDVTGSGGRTTWSAELLDEARLIQAVLSGGYGIPGDVLTVNPAKLNEYARSLHERINLWPGVRAKKSTKVI